jgi:poly(A) polymerase
MTLIDKFFSTFKKSSKKATSKSIGSAPIIIPRSDHSISRKHISPQAVKVLYGLKDAGFDAYLVGGCVRDLLLGHKPKDFDVATDASPEQVHKIFKRSRLIGRRFKLVHVGFGRHAIEVATFRAPPVADKYIDEQGRITRDNEFGTLEQDAWRRDFSINALYYNIRDFSIVDYTGGMADLEAGVIRMIGDVETRYREDPVRMLRALRFKAKLGLNLDAETERWIPELADLLQDIPSARLFDESLKLFLGAYGRAVYTELQQYDLLKQLLPQTAQILATGADDTAERLITAALTNTDTRIAEDKPVTPAFIFAALLWPVVKVRWADFQQKGVPAFPALNKASSAVFIKQGERISIPKRFSFMSRDIWTLQIRLNQRQGKRALQALAHPKFRAGYDFLLLRNEAGEDASLAELADWWTRFQIASELEQTQMVKEVPRHEGTANKRPRRRRRRKPASRSDAAAQKAD